VTTLSPALRDALTQWLEWAEAGGPEHPVFRRDRGLCGSIRRVGREWVRKELGWLLSLDYGQTHYPFGKANYLTRRHFETQHQDPARLAWVRKVLGREERNEG